MIYNSSSPDRLFTNAGQQQLRDLSLALRLFGIDRDAAVSQKSSLAGGAVYNMYPSIGFEMIHLKKLLTLT